MPDDMALIVHKPKNQTPELLPVLRVYECTQPDENGQRVNTMIVAAHHVQEASELVYAHSPWPYYTIAQLEGMFATGSPRILYNDEKR